jgi:hypothetical protein
VSSCTHAERTKKRKITERFGFSGMAAKALAISSVAATPAALSKTPL